MEKKSDFMCACSMCANYDKCIADEKEQEKLMEEMCRENRSINLWYFLWALFIGIYFGYFWHYSAIKGQIAEKEKQIEEIGSQIEKTKEEIGKIKNSREYLATIKCENSGKLKADCIVWELKKTK